MSKTPTAKDFFAIKGKGFKKIFERQFTMDRQKQLYALIDEYAQHVLSTQTKEEIRCTDTFGIVDVYVKKNKNE